MAKAKSSSAGSSSAGRSKTGRSKIDILLHGDGIIYGRKKDLPAVRKKADDGREYVKLGIDGIDHLFEKGVPKGSSVLLCGGPGSGKTIFALQALYHAAKNGKKALYMTFEESPDRLRNHMLDFGWNPDQLIHDGYMRIEKYSPFDVMRQVEAMLERAKGELLIDVKPVLFPVDFIPDVVVIDSLSAIEGAFISREEPYRIYLEQLFSLLSENGSTSLLVSEALDPDMKARTSGMEEFLADGIILFYHVRHGSARDRGVEVLKMRGAKFQKKVCAMQINEGKGIEVYPEQEVFAEI